MFNPEAKLNPDIFSSDIPQVPTRNGFGDELVQAADENPNVALCAVLC